MPVSVVCLFCAVSYKSSRGGYDTVGQLLFYRGVHRISNSIRSMALVPALEDLEKRNKKLLL